MEHIEAVNSKDTAQKKIMYLSFMIWIVFCVLTLLVAERSFTYGVFWGGIISMVNLRWLSSNINAMVRLVPGKGASFMTIRFVLRLSAVGVAAFALLAWVKVNVLGLLLGLSVVILSIMCYAWYTYLFARGN